MVRTSCARFDLRIQQKITLPPHLIVGGEFGSKTHGSDDSFVLPGTFDGVEGLFHCHTDARRWIWGED